MDQFGSPPPRPRVLLVDDDFVVLSLIQRGLADAGMEVMTARDGTSGIRLLIEHLMDLELLITDLRMPGLDGRALIRIVRAQGGERELPILVLAGTITPQDREVLTNLGVNALIEKSEGPSRVAKHALRLVAENRRRLDSETDQGQAIVARIELKTIDLVH